MAIASDVEVVERLPGHHGLLVVDVEGRSVPAVSASTGVKVFITSTSPIVSPTATASPISLNGAWSGEAGDRRSREAGRLRW